MAEIQHNGNSHKGSKARIKRPVPRIDMTPMVDLAFLLLTFFVLTATFTKPKTMELAFPPPDGEQTTSKNGITFLLSKDNRIFYYEGEFREKDNDRGNKTRLSELSFGTDGQNSLRKFLLEKNKDMQKEIEALSAQYKQHNMPDSIFKSRVKEARRKSAAYIYLIKTDNAATYKNVVDVIDELNYNLVGKYAIVDMMKREQDLLNDNL